MNLESTHLFILFVVVAAELASASKVHTNHLRPGFLQITRSEVLLSDIYHILIEGKCHTKLVLGIVSFASTGIWFRKMVSDAETIFPNWTMGMQLQCLNSNWGKGRRKQSLHPYFMHGGGSMKNPPPIPPFPSWDWMGYR